MPALKKHLFLIGYRGCGKSTVAQLLASRLHTEAIDTDLRVELIAGKSIREIFERESERSFRALETRAIAELTDALPCVVALGGGAPVQLENREMIARLGKTIWLRAPASTLVQRIAHDYKSTTQRPPLTDLSQHDEVNQLLILREPIYQESSNWTIDVQDLEPTEVCDQIMARISEQDFSDLVSCRTF